jgi:signal transduction histidine kinase
MRLLPRRDPDGGSDRRWTAALALALGLLATFAAWRSVSSHEDSEVRRTTQLAAQAIKKSIVTEMEWQTLGLDRLAMLWKAADPAQELWTKNAELYIQHRPGCVAVEWLTSDGRNRVVVTAGGTSTRALAFAGLPTALLGAASKARAAVISAPEALPDGTRQWAIAYPVYANGDPRGFVVTFFDLEQSLQHILADVKQLGFSVAVAPPSQPEYVLPGTSRRHDQEWGTAVDVPLSGTEWRLRVWPTSDVVYEIRSKLPEEALAFGCAVSLLLGLALYFSAEASRSYARVRRANEALKREIGLREYAEEELRVAHAELETRIDRRTGEVAAANALLQKEVAEHQRAEETLRQLTGRLFQSQDQERRRLARELHDGAVQNLVALAMDVGMIRDAVPADDTGTRGLVDECGRLIEQSMSELRTISYLLHPPYFDELGLTAALRDFVHGFATRSGIQVTLDVDPQLGRLGHEMELAIYRVVQEALSNVHRHATSRTATIALERHADFVQLEVTDAGRGIPPEILAREGAELSGVGIAGMRERVRALGGRLEIQSDCGGTSIQAVLPTPVVASAAS